MSDKIICIDDEQDILDLMTLYLRDQNFEVDCYESPDDALQSLKTKEYAVILCDVRMPNHNGVEFLTNLSGISSATSRINMSSHADMDMVLTALKSNKIFDFIKKPLKKEYILSTIKKAVSHYKLFKERAELQKSLQEKNILLEKLNKSLDDEVHKKTFELHTRDKLLQHLAGCGFHSDPFLIINKFCLYLCQEAEIAIYSDKNDSFKKIHHHGDSEGLFPESLELDSPPINKSNKECLNIPLIKYNQKIGIFSIATPYTLKDKPKEAILHLIPIISLLVYDLMTENSQDVLSKLFNTSSLTD